MSTSIPVSVVPAPDTGIVLLSPAEHGFSSLVEEIAPEQGRDALRLRPFLAVVSNQSPKTIIAYGVMFRVIKPDGKAEKYLSYFRYPNAAAGDLHSPFPKGNELAPNEKRVVGVGFELTPGNNVLRWFDHVEQNVLKLHRNAVSVAIELEAVVFDDGTVKGTNSVRLQRYFASDVTEAQKLFIAIDEAVRRGVPCEQAITESTTEALRKPTTLRPETDSEASARSAAGEARRIAASVGAQRACDMFTRAIRRSPFTMKQVGEKTS